jgi:ABC-type lipoprotein release transport system permease subunit
LRTQYSSILKEGADVYVTRDNFGSNAPIELSLADRFKGIQGIARVVPRVIGRTYAQGKFLAIIGIDSGQIPPAIHVSKGRKPTSKGEVVLGWRAAQYLNVQEGSQFSLERHPEQRFLIVGIFSSQFTVWESDLMVMGFEDASNLFDFQGKATDLLIYTRPGYEQIVDVIIRTSDREQGLNEPPLRVQTRALISRYSLRGLNIKAGVFAGFYCLVLGLGIPCIGLISGFGLAEKRREIGVIKALGWQTQDVMEVGALEHLVLGLLSVPLVNIVAAVWIHILNGAGIAEYFIADFGILVPFPVPWKMLPLPFVLSVVAALILALVGSIYTTWRTAIVAPAEAMKA